MTPTLRQRLHEACPCRSHYLDRGWWGCMDFNGNCSCDCHWGPGTGRGGCTNPYHVIADSIPDAQEPRLDMVQPSEMTPEALAQFCESAAKELSARIPDLQIVLGKLEAAQKISRALLQREVNVKAPEPLPSEVEELADRLFNELQMPRALGRAGWEAVAHLVLADRKVLEEKLREAEYAAALNLELKEKALAQARRETAEECATLAEKELQLHSQIEHDAGYCIAQAIRARFGSEGK